MLESTLSLAAATVVAATVATAEGSTTHIPHPARSEGVPVTRAMQSRGGAETVG